MQAPSIGHTDPLKPGLFADICDLATEGIYAVDLDRQIVYWNPAAEKISGYGTRSVLGRRCSDRMLRHCDASGRILCGESCPLQATIVDGLPRTIEAFLLHREGRRIPVRVHGEAVRNGEGRIVGSVEFFHDLRQPLAILEELKGAPGRGELDPLTGIGNRRLIEGALEALSLGDAGSAQAGVMFFDIDHFNEVNDRYGRDAGDRVLREIALTIAGELAARHVVARWGGGTFAVLAPNVGPDAAGELAETVRAVVSAMFIPHEEGEFAPTVSAGVTVTRGGEQPEGVADRAQRLLAMSKRKGRNQITVG